MMQESKIYLDKRDKKVVTLVLLSDRFVRVKPERGLDIVLSKKSFEENYSRITK